MPVTITSVPQLLEPVYNPIYYSVYSNKTTEEAFNFLFSVSINGQYITTNRLPAIPGTSACTYSPATILKSYLSYDLTHNVTGSTESSDCIRQYEIAFGEEYVNFWSFDTNYPTTGPWSGYTTLSTSGDSVNTFISGDTVFVQQASGFTYAAYNGTFTVLDAGPTYVVIDIAYVSTPVNPGTVIFADRRKTTYFGNQNLIENPNFYYNGGDTKWTSFGYPGCSSSFGVTVANKLVLSEPDVSCGDTFIIQYTGGTFVAGNTYTVGFTVDNVNNPSSSPQYVQARLGGNVGGAYGGAGSYSSQIVCGPTGILELIGYFDGDTSGFGSHSFSLTAVTVTNETVSSGYTFNASLQYEQVPTWSYNELVMQTGSTYTVGQYLTNQPETVKTKLEERGSIGWLNFQPYIAGADYYMYILINRFDGSPTIPIPFPISEMQGSTTNKRIIEFGVYPWNLNQKSQEIYSIDVIDEDTKSYEIFLFQEPDPIGHPFEFVQIAESKTFNLENPCSKYENIRFMFLNTYGQFDYFSANLVSHKNISITRDKYRKVLPPNYTRGTRGSTTISAMGQESYSVVCNWLNQEEITWLEELWDSPEVYLVLDDGQLMPIDIDNNSIDAKKVTTELFNYTFNYSKSVRRNRQTN